MKVALVIFSLTSGGAERVMSILANELTERGYDIVLISGDSIDTDFYTLRKNICRESIEQKKVSTNIMSAIMNNIVKIYRLRSMFRKHNPELIISFMDRMNVSVLIASKWLSVPVIVSEHTNPQRMHLKGILSKVRLWTYKWAAAVVVLISDHKQELEKFVPSSHIYVIPNPALPTKLNIKWTLPFSMPSPSVVAMGRLVPLKGFDLLLKAFAKCQYDNWSLVILGEGEQRNQLLSMIKKLNLESRVMLPGRVNNPGEVFQRSDFFVLSSRVEGFPMALLEAMSSGLPVISFDCPTGPSEIIRDGIDGILVPMGDIEAMTTAMNRLMGNKKERLRLAKNAREVVDRYSVSMVMEKWIKLLSDVKQQHT